MKWAKQTRTGYRKPKAHLKVWSPESSDLTKQLTPRLHVSMVDEELPVKFGENVRKSWYIGLTQPKSVAKTLGPVRGLPKGDSIVLFEDDVVALIEHLLNGGLINEDDDGVLLNGPADEESDERYEEDKAFMKAQLRKRKSAALKRKRKKAKKS